MNAEQIKEALSDFAIETLSQINDDSPEAVTLQSIIGMVHTLITEGRILELDEAMRLHFAEYYFTDHSEFVDWMQNQVSDQAK